MKKNSILSLKMLSVFFMITFAFSTSAQETKIITINAGTPIQVTCENGLRASETKNGESVNFRVLTPVKIDDITVIPYYSLVRASVIKATKSKICGINGKLRIKVMDILLPSGESIPLATRELNFDGDNRAGWVVPVGCLLLWPILFVPGQRAEIYPGYTTTVNVANETKIKVKNENE